MKVIKLLVVITLLFLLISCPDYMNVVDEESKNYQGYPSYSNPDDIEIVSPSNNSTFSFFPDLSWSKIVSADEYHVQLSSENNFSSLLWESTLVTNTVNIPDTANLIVERTYYLRVQAYKENLWDKYSEIHSFSLEKLVSNINPSDSGSTPDTTPLLNWNDVSNASGYQTRYANSSGELLTASVINIIQSEYEITEVQALDSSVYWQVRAVTIDEEPSGWSKICTFTILSNNGPEINIKQDLTDIPSGESYNFGSVVVDSSSSSPVIFTITNTGSDDLILTDSPTVSISGTDASMFSIETQPSSPVSASSNTTFSITFSPANTGNKTATVTIPNNDSDENPYLLTISGSGISGGLPVGEWGSTNWDECVWAD